MRNRFATTLLITATTLSPTILIGAPSQSTEVNPVEVGSTIPDIALT